MPVGCSYIVYGRQSSIPAAGVCGSYVIKLLFFLFEVFDNVCFKKNNFKYRVLDHTLGSGATIGENTEF